MNDFRENLRKKLTKYIKINNLTYRSFIDNGLGDMSKILSRGSTHINTLFNVSNFLEIDIRNLFIFSDSEYNFKNSFDSSEEFLFFLGNRFKEFRVKRKLKASDIDKYVARVYCFESNKETTSLKKFYTYLNKLGMTPDEFFLDDLGDDNKKEHKIKKENKEISGNTNNVEYVNEARDFISLLSLEDIFRRVDELEEIRGVKIAKSVIPTRTVMPTVHVFLNICKSLKISPSDFFDFTKRKNEDFEYYKSRIDNKVIIGNIRKIIKADGKNSQKFLRLDNIINFCNNKKIDIKEFLKPRFLEGLEGYGNISLQCAFTP